MKNNPMNKGKKNFFIGHKNQGSFGVHIKYGGVGNFYSSSSALRLCLKLKKIMYVFQFYQL